MWLLQFNYTEQSVSQPPDGYMYIKKDNSGLDLSKKKNHTFSFVYEVIAARIAIWHRKFRRNQSRASGYSNRVELYDAT
jgi:hypothetical protein